jgi:hypothetical protein
VQGNFVFIPGPQVFTNVDITLLENNRIVYLELEEPNRFFVNETWFHHFDYDKYFSKVLSICPYTTYWLNTKYGTDNRSHTFIPINEETIPPPVPKLWDIMYAGHVVSNAIAKDLAVISEFKYRFISNDNNPLVTNRAVCNNEKLKLISESKITLTHSLLYPTDQHINFIKKLEGMEHNEAFCMLEKGVVPQIKGRTFEAALCRSLILCKRDYWNVIERYFKPDVHFLYYEENNLRDRIREILSDYDAYTCIVDEAYKKAQEYTVQSFFCKYIQPL